MRIWTTKEKELIEKSRRARAEQQRIKRRYQLYRRIAAFLGFAILIGIALVSFRSYQLAEFDRILSIALQTEKDDPTEALKQVNAALIQFPTKITGIQARQSILDNNAFYFKKIKLKTEIEGITLSPNQQHFAVFSGHHIEIFDLQGRSIGYHSIGNQIRAIAFHPLKDEVLITGDGGTLFSYGYSENNQGQEVLNSTILVDTVRVNALVYAHDGSFFVTGDRDGEIALWRDNQKLPDTIFNAHANQVEALAISPNDQIIASSGYEDQSIKLWQVDSLKVIEELPLNTRILSLCFSQEHQIILAGGRNGSIYMIDLEDDCRIQQFPSHKYPINQLGFAHGNTYVLSASDDQTIRVWNDSLSNLGIFKGHSDFVNGLIAPLNADFFVSAGADSTIRFWNLEPFVMNHFTPKPGKVITTLSLSKQFLAVGTSAQPGKDVFQQFENAQLPNESYLMDLNNDHSFIALPEHQGSIYDIKVMPTFQRVFTAGNDGKVLISDFSGNLIQSFGGSPENPEAEVLAIDANPQKDLVLVGSMDSSAYLFNLEGRLQKALTGHQGAIRAVAFIPGKGQVLTASYDRSIIRWGINDNFKQTYLGHKGRIASLTVSADGTEFISGGDDRQAILWDLHSGEPIQHFRSNLKNKSGGSRILDVDISLDKSRVALAITGGEVVVYTRHGEPLQTIQSTKQCRGKCGLLFQIRSRCTIFRQC